MTVSIRQLRRDEVEPLRELRLRALREDPGAFAETFEQARARPLEDWRSWAADASRAIIVAVDGECWVGMIAGRRRQDSIWLSALWVDPSARGTGLHPRRIRRDGPAAATARRPVTHGGLPEPPGQSCQAARPVTTSRLPPPMRPSERVLPVGTSTVYSVDPWPDFALER